MNRVTHEYNASNRIEGHLIDRLVSSTYAGVFRNEILTAIEG